MMKPMLVMMLLTACAAGPASSTSVAATTRPAAAAVSPSGHAPEPSVECRNRALPPVRFTLASPPPPSWYGETSPRTIRFWNDTRLVGEKVVSVGVSQESTRVDAGTAIAARGGGIELRLVDITYSGAVGRPLGFTGELIENGAHMALACSWTP